MVGVIGSQGQRAPGAVLGEAVGSYCGHLVGKRPRSHCPGPWDSETIVAPDDDTYLSIS